jgi:hypothetical protein
MPADPQVRDAIGCKKIIKGVLLAAGLLLMFGLIISAYRAGVWE